MDRIGTPVTINGRTAGTPGPAPISTGAPLKVRIPNPSRKIGKFDAIAPMAFARRITFQNLETAGTGPDLQIWPGNQATPAFITLHAGQSLTIDAVMTEFSVQSSTAATAQWEALAIVAS